MTTAQNHFKFLSFNVEQGHGTRHKLDYLWRGWQHFLPSISKLHRLSDIAQVVSPYDVVALQEVDGGSIRSGHINHVEYLAQKADFPIWHIQRNRNFGKLAQHSNGMLSRIVPAQITNHKLPGLVSGRGAIFMQLGSGKDAVMVVMMHLALVRKTQIKQLHYIIEKISHYRHVILMGDMNCPVHHLEKIDALKKLAVHPLTEGLNTYPSWRPKFTLDQILISGDIKALQVDVLAERHSDHLAVAAELQLPTQLERVS